MDLILKHVGGRIRMYRKNIGMSMETLAQRVHKSKASISKYESGQIDMDIGTLYEIAKALEVAPYHLLDYSPPRDKVSVLPTIGPFVKADHLYLYHMGHRSVYLSTLRLDTETDSGQVRATLFYKVTGPGEPVMTEPSGCIYHGMMYSHDMVLCFVLRNHYNPVENILLNFVIPMHKTDILVGMISGLGVDPLAPTAHKVILAGEPLPINDELRAMLTIQPDAFKAMKRSNRLFIPLR